MSDNYSPRRFMAHEITAHNSVTRDPIGHHPAAVRWANDVADGLMSAVDGERVEFSGPRAYRPVTGARGAASAHLLRALEGRPDPWGDDPDRTTRHWRPGSAR